jgi:hypothetical protein
MPQTKHEISRIIIVKFGTLRYPIANCFVSYLARSPSIYRAFNAYCKNESRSLGFTEWYMLSYLMCCLWGLTGWDRDPAVLFSIYLMVCYV